MKRTEAAKILRYHNKWRRYGDGEMLDPKLIGQAIDLAVQVLAPKRKKTARKWRDVAPNEPIAEGDKYKSSDGEWYISNSIGMCPAKTGFRYRTRRPLKGASK